MMKTLINTLLIILLSNTAIAQSVSPHKTGAELTAAFYAKQIDTIWQLMDATMQGALKSRDALANFREQIDAQLGNEQTLIDESVNTESGLEIYRRRAKFEKFPGIILVQWALSNDGHIAGFVVAPDQSSPQAAAPSRYLDYQTKTTLRLPFNDEFLVFWGGRSVEQNYHASSSNQRFAYDLIMVREHSSHNGDGKHNEDYFCFGKPVLAPAKGTVVQVVNDIADNNPGQMNAKEITGNHVIIDHGNGEYSLLAHLHKGSVTVRSGEVVKAGTHVGDCGNSGNSSEPHLHYQLQDGPEFGSSAGLPAQFENYLTDNQLTTRGEPVRGQHIRPAQP